VIAITPGNRHTEVSEVTKATEVFGEELDVR